MVAWWRLRQAPGLILCLHTHTRAHTHTHTQEWNEIQYNGVHWEPPMGAGAPGEIHEDKTYTFKYPRPPKCVKRVCVASARTREGHRPPPPRTHMHHRCTLHTRRAYVLV